MNGNMPTGVPKVIPISIASNGNSKVEIKETEEQIAAKNITDNEMTQINFDNQ